jgi:hypothetical protein
MAVPEGDQVGGSALDKVAQTASKQAVALAREQVDVAQSELTARARQAGPGVAMVGGGALLAALASGTGTAALILLLARRPGASAAALGVTGAYAGAGVYLARRGFERVREAGPPLPDESVQDEPDQDAEQALGSAERRTKSATKSRQNAKPDTSSAKRRTKSAAKSPGRSTTAAKSPTQRTGRPKPGAKSPSSRGRPSRPQTDRRQAS